MTNQHRFPSDTRGEPDQRPMRKILLPPTRGDPEVYALHADSDQPMSWSSADPRLDPFNRPTNWSEGRELRHLSQTNALAYIPIVEARLALNADLLVAYPAEIEALEQVINAHDEKVGAAHARVIQVVQGEREWLEQSGAQWKPSGWIVQSSMTIAPELFLSSRQCLLQDTVEWKRLEWIKSQRPTQAVKERTRKQELLREERILTGQLESRLYDLRALIAWWEREMVALEEVS